MSLEKVTETVLNALTKLQEIRYSTFAKLVVLCVSLVLLYTAWEYREPVWKKVVAENKITVGQLPIPPSKQTQDEISAMVRQSEYIGAAQIVNVNFLTNERAVVYSFSDDDKITYEMGEFYKHRTSSTPFFLPKNSIGAVENNWRSVGIMNGVYSCDNFEQTIGVRNFPNLIGRVAQLCSVSIPPYEGYFSGYVVVWLLTDPQPGQAEDIERKVRSVARAIFEREFKR